MRQMEHEELGLFEGDAVEDAAAKARRTTAAKADDGGRRLLGLTAEDAAVRFREGEGFRVRDRNFACRYGEVDIVAERGELLCFVEVRMRSSAAWGDPSQTVTFGKQRKVVKTALHYLNA